MRIGALRDTAGLAAGAGLLALTALIYGGCDRFTATPYVAVAVAAGAAALIGALAETDPEERRRAAAFASVLVALAGFVLLMVLFPADACTGA